MLHTIQHSQESIICHDNNILTQAFLSSLKSGNQPETYGVAVALNEAVNVDAFVSFCFIHEDKNIGLGFHLDGLETETKRLYFYKRNKSAVDTLLTMICKDNNIGLAEYLESQREYFINGEPSRFSFQELADAFINQDTSYMCYESLVSSVVCGIVNYLATFFLALSGGLLTIEQSKGVKHKDYFNTPKGMAYTYLHYEPSNEKLRLAHALIDSVGYEAFVADARMLDKLDSFTGDDLNGLSTRYSRVAFCMKNKQKVIDWVDNDIATNPFNMGFADWARRLKNNDTADLFDSISEENISNVIFGETSEHDFFDEITDALMLYVIGKISREFAFFCKSNGNTFNCNGSAVLNDESRSIDNALYNQAYKQAKVDILKALQAV